MGQQIFTNIPQMFLLSQIASQQILFSQQIFTNKLKFFVSFCVNLLIYKNILLLEDRRIDDSTSIKLSFSKVDEQSQFKSCCF